MFAKDLKDNNCKTFALDRLTELEISKNKFEIPPNFNIENVFKYSFGIIKEEKGEPEEILLSFDPIQGKYLKSLPLHQSQQIVTDNQNEMVIMLKLFVTLILFKRFYRLEIQSKSFNPIL